MAKCRHRSFEIYEYRDEATQALTPKVARPVLEGTAPEAWTFKHLAVSQSDCVTHVQFKNGQTFGGETALELRDEFVQLSDRLVRDSKVLFDFDGVESFCEVSINALDLFNRQLRSKGSRIALCCLDSSVLQSFYKGSSGRARE